MLKARAPGAPKPWKHLEPHVQGKYEVGMPEKEIQMSHQTQMGRYRYGELGMELGS